MWIQDRRLGVKVKYRAFSSRGLIPWPTPRSPCSPLTWTEAEVVVFPFITSAAFAGSGTVDCDSKEHLIDIRWALDGEA